MEHSSAERSVQPVTAEELAELSRLIKLPDLRKPWVQTRSFMSFDAGSWGRVRIVQPQGQARSKAVQRAAASVVSMVPAMVRALAAENAHEMCERIHRSIRMSSGVVGLPDGPWKLSHGAWVQYGGWVHHPRAVKMHAGWGSHRLYPETAPMHCLNTHDALLQLMAATPRLVAAIARGRIA